MLGPSEEVLHTFAVALRKRPGVLTATSERLVWAPDRPAVGEMAMVMADGEVSIPHAIMAAQAVNTSSARVLLKLTLRQLVKDATDYTFSFEGPHAVADRDTIKGFVNQVLVSQRREEGLQLPRESSLLGETITTASPLPSRSSTPAAAAGSPVTASSTGTAKRLNETIINARIAALVHNKDLQKLHMELVVGKIVSEEDFWSTRKHILEKYLPKPIPPKGIPSALVDIRPVSEGSSTQINYEFTPKIIQAILMQYTAVNRAYKDYVPDKMSESEFWKKFVQSQFFYRDRDRERERKRGAGAMDDDLFDKYQREIDQEEQEAKKRKLDADLLLDLSATQEDRLEDIGNRADASMQGGTINSTAARLLRHASVVLKNASSDAALTTPVSTRSQRCDLFEKELRFKDLDATLPEPVESLTIPEPAKYFEAPSSSQPLSTVSSLNGDTGLQESITQTQYIIQMFAGWQVSLAHMPLDPLVAQGTIRRLFSDERTGRHAYGGTVDIAAQRARTLVATQHLAVCEILRHFWLAMQSREPHMINKTQRMVTTLRGLRGKLAEFQSDAFSDDPEAIGHVNKLAKQVDHALATHEASRASARA